MKHVRDMIRTYSQSGELCYNFCISNDLNQMINFSTKISDSDSPSPALFDFYHLSLLFVLQWLSLHWEILIMLSQFPLTFCQILAYGYSCADWHSLCDHLRDVLWEDIFKPGASAAAREFCEWVHVGIYVYVPQVVIDLYIPHRKYQVKSHSTV